MPRHDSEQNTQKNIYSMIPYTENSKTGKTKIYSLGIQLQRKRRKQLPKKVKSVVYSGGKKGGYI